MILTCPSCETQYFADDSTIGESGRTVKCAACNHSWFVTPEGVAPKGAAPSMPAHEVYRERVREQRRQKSRFAALTSWLVTASVFFALGISAIIFRNDVVKLWPQAGAAYKQIGFSVNRFGLEFADIERSRTFNDTIPIVTVSGKARNVARSEIETPFVKVDLKDEAGNTVATKYGPVLPSRLPAGEIGDFQIVLEQAPMESFEIDLSFVARNDVPPQPADAAPTEETAVSEPENELTTEEAPAE